MPSIPAIVLMALSAAGAPQNEPGRAAQADYRAAFDDSTDFAPADAAPPRQRFPSPPPAAAGPAHLPIRFRSANEASQHPGVVQASATEGVQLLRPAAADAALPLTPPGEGGLAVPHRLPTASIPTVIGSLAAVVGLFLIVAWVMRRSAAPGSGLLPREVVEVLGRTALAGKQQLQLLRLGNKLILVSISPTGIESLTEVTDPSEVDRLTGLCYQAHPNSATTSFRQVFRSFEDPRGTYSASPRGGDRLDLSQLDALTRGAIGAEGIHGR
jgi:flagellar biogenesis protein FliO